MQKFSTNSVLMKDILVSEGKKSTSMTPHLNKLYCYHSKINESDNYIHKRYIKSIQNLVQSY